MAFNKFKTKDGTVLLDLTKDTVTVETLKKGMTAHDKSGEIIEGVLEDPKLQEKTVIENGDVVPDEGYDGLSKVTVNVAGKVLTKFDGTVVIE